CARTSRTTQRRPRARVRGARGAWVVRGDDRLQPYGPGRAKRRRIWIAPHWKGPERAPLKADAREGAFDDAKSALVRSFSTAGTVRSVTWRGSRPESRGRARCVTIALSPFGFRPWPGLRPPRCRNCS